MEQSAKGVTLGDCSNAAQAMALQAKLVGKVEGIDEILSMEYEEEDGKQKRSDTS